MHQKLELDMCSLWVSVGWQRFLSSLFPQMNERRALSRSQQLCAQKADAIKRKCSLIHKELKDVTDGDLVILAGLREENWCKNNSFFFFKPCTVQIGFTHEKACTCVTIPIIAHE